MRIPFLYPWNIPKPKPRIINSWHMKLVKLCQIDYSDLTRTDRFSPQKGNGFGKGNGTRAILKGKSGLVKYYFMWPEWRNSFHHFGSILRYPRAMASSFLKNTLALNRCFQIRTLILIQIRHEFSLCKEPCKGTNMSATLWWTFFWQFLQLNIPQIQ